MTMQQKIYDKLSAACAPTYLEVINESHLHSGHAGDDGSGESHFRLEIRADTFDKMSRVTREREIYKILNDEMSQIHALSIKFV